MKKFVSFVFLVVFLTGCIRFPEYPEVERMTFEWMMEGSENLVVLQLEPDFEKRVLVVDYYVRDVDGDFIVDGEAEVGDVYFSDFEEVVEIYEGLVFGVDFESAEPVRENGDLLKMVVVDDTGKVRNIDILSAFDLEDDEKVAKLREFYNSVLLLFQEERY